MRAKAREFLPGYAVAAQMGPCAGEGDEEPLVAVGCNGIPLLAEFEPLMSLALLQHRDGHARCSWCGEGEKFVDYIQYHDEEWAMPTGSDRALFEKIVLEGFQAGLSWITVLRKRATFRKRFDGFDFEKVARFDRDAIASLLQEPGIIRHRGKIMSAINNAKRVCALVDQQGEGALARLIWAHEPAPASRPPKITPEVASTLSHTAESVALSKALKKLGFSFVGPTTMYAMMQAACVVNDHLEGCSKRAGANAARAAFVLPKATAKFEANAQEHSEPR
jgi:DNA-3-methyladenine glycosylase I